MRFQAMPMGQRRQMCARRKIPSTLILSEHAKAVARNDGFEHIVEQMRLELTTSSMRPRRSPS